MKRPYFILSILFILSVVLSNVTVSANASVLANNPEVSEPRQEVGFEPYLSNVSDDNQTYFNLYAAVQGETNAAAEYRAFAEKADAEGYPTVARLFLATADAESKHAEDEWAVLRGLGATLRPVAETPTVGTTAQNLQTALDGETYEYTVMYPEFLATAQEEGMADAARIFELALKAEQVHAGNYDNVLKNLGNVNYINKEYKVVYRCPVCGEVVSTRPNKPNRCPICGERGQNFVIYNPATI